MNNQFLRFNYQIDLMKFLEGQLEELKRLKLIEVKEFKRHEHIYKPEQYASHIYVIKQGRVKIEINVGDSKTIIKNVFTRGELFGENALLSDSFRTNFAVAMEKTELYVLSREEVYRQMRRQNNLTGYIIKLLGTRLLAVEEKVEALIFKNSRTRIIDFLDKLAKKKGQRIGYEIVVRKFLTHQEIANITSTSRQSVTTILNELRNKNILTFNRKRLLIRDIGLLKAEMT